MDLDIRAKLAKARATFNDDSKNDHEAPGHVLDILEASPPPKELPVEPRRFEGTSPRGVPSLHPPAATKNDPQFDE